MQNVYVTGYVSADPDVHNATNKLSNFQTSKIVYLLCLNNIFRSMSE